MTIKNKDNEASALSIFIIALVVGCATFWFCWIMAQAGEPRSHFIVCELMGLCGEL